MSAIKIGIVEDEGITSEVIKMSLQKLKYKVAKPAFTYVQAVQMFETEKPDLVILDIKLGEEKDGIDLAKLLKEKYFTPFIFLTANSDIATLEQAKKVRPAAFLVKPFSQIDLHAAIEIAVSNHQSHRNDIQAQKNYVIIKVGRTYEKIDVNNIFYLENDGHYFIIHLVNGDNISVRASANEMMDLLPIDNFFQINRTYIVNTSLIKKIDSSKVYIGKKQLEYKPIFKDRILEMMIEKG
jgi:DNA-binding LytR/AlgR family response regulator